jgi:hypothetical protein
VIEREFQDAEGAKAIGSSHGNFRTPDIPPGKMVERFGFVLSGCEPKPVRFLIFLS